MARLMSVLLSQVWLSAWVWCALLSAHPAVSAAAFVSFSDVDYIDPAVLLRNAELPACAPLVRALLSSADVALTHPAASVTQSSQLPPDGDLHSYYSWADYFWPVPSCNLSDPNFMRDCDYERRDGQVNPDTALCKQKSAANAVAEDATLLALAALLTPSSSNRSAYTRHAELQLRTFFLDNTSYMLPNLDWGQVVRGRNYEPWVGRAEGIIDVRAFAHIPVAIAVLDRYPPSPQWKQRSARVRAWLAQLHHWLTNSTIGRDEQNATNNHGTWHYVQTVTYTWSAGLHSTAQQLLQQFLSHQYQHQFTANGSQPLELARTRPLHYSCFNLQALTYLAKFARQWGVDLWRLPNSQGATIQTAVDFLLQRFTPPFSEEPDEVVPLLVDVINEYGDPTGRYGRQILTFNHGRTAPLFSSLWQLLPSNRSQHACDAYAETHAGAGKARERRRQAQVHTGRWD